MYRLSLIVTCLLIAPAAHAQQIVVVGSVQPSDYLAWTIDDPNATVDSAQALQMRVRIDQPFTGTFLTLQQQTCSGVASAIICSSPLGSTIAALLQARGAHALTLTAVTAGVESTQSIPYSLPLPLGCADLTGVVKPLGATWGERNQRSTLNQADAVGKLEAAGWKVRIYRQQYKDPSQPSSSDGGYWWLLATCTGLVQAGT